MKPIGIPYAEAVIVDGKTYRRCPVCKELVPEGARMNAPENNYAIHYGLHVPDYRDIAVTKIAEVAFLLGKASADLKRGYTHDAERTINGAGLLLRDAHGAIDRLLDERGGDGL